MGLWNSIDTKPPSPPTTSGVQPDYSSIVSKRSTTSSLRRVAPRFEFPDLKNETTEDRSSALEQLRKHGEDWTLFFIRYYEIRAARRMQLAVFLRTTALVCILIGSVIAASRLLDSRWQKAIVEKIAGTGIETVPAEIGLILFGVAAGLLAVDRFSNVSSNWLRYKAAAMALDRRLIEFRLAWLRRSLNLFEKSDSPPSEVANPELVRNTEKLDAVCAFFTAIFDLVEQETQEWAKAFQRSQQDFDQYLLQQNARTQEQRKASRRN